MYEIAAIFAATVFTILWFAGANKGQSPKAFFTTMMMFWGAALMWGVDCVSEALDGNAMFDMSRDATWLAAIIIAAGLGVFLILRFWEIRHGRRIANQ